MSDPREPSDDESTKNEAVTPAETGSPSVPPFPSEPAAPPSEPAAPPAPPAAPTTPPLPPASTSMPPIESAPSAPPAASAPSAPSAPGYGPPSTQSGPPSNSPSPSYGAPPVYGTPAQTSGTPTAPPAPSYGSPYGSPAASAGGVPPAGQAPWATGAYAPGQIPPRNKGNWMGITSIILGGLALLVCWVPFLDYVTVIGALAGLVLGLIALFKKFGSRALALTGTIVSGVAFLLTVLFIVIYTITFFSATDDGPDYTDPSYSSSPSDEPTDSSDDPSYVPGDPTAVPGDPTPSAGATVCADGTAIALGKAGILTYDGENQAEVTVNDVELNATDAILAENSLNETPPSGYEYALISLTVKQLGTEPFPAGGIRGIFEGVATDVASPADYAVIPSPELLFAPDLTPGASTTGNIAVFVPSSGAEQGSLLVENYLTDNTCELKIG